MQRRTGRQRIADKLESTGVLDQYEWWEVLSWDLRAERARRILGNPDDTSAEGRVYIYWDKAIDPHTRKKASLYIQWDMIRIGGKEVLGVSQIKVGGASSMWLVDPSEHTPLKLK